MRLKDKVAVITGSGQGIGRAIALAMANEGAKIVTNNRWQGTPGGDAATTAKEIIDARGQAIPYFGDVSKFLVAKNLMETAIINFGRLDILVNNANVIKRNWIWDTTEKDWDIKKCPISLIDNMSSSIMSLSSGVKSFSPRCRIVNGSPSIRL